MSEASLQASKFEAQVFLDTFVTTKVSKKVLNDLSRYQIRYFCHLNLTFAQFRILFAYTRAGFGNDHNPQVNRPVRSQAYYCACDPSFRMLSTDLA